VADQVPHTLIEVLGELGFLAFSSGSATACFCTVLLRSSIIVSYDSQRIVSYIEAFNELIVDY
jgi:hypothetical protein